MNGAVQLTTLSSITYPNNAAPSTNTPTPAHYNPNYYSIESQIIREPAKQHFPLSLIKDI